MTTISQFTAQDGGKVTVCAFGSITVASVFTRDVRPATSRDKGKTCVCGNVIYVADRHAGCKCDNPQVYN